MNTHPLPLTHLQRVMRDEVLRLLRERGRIQTANTLGWTRHRLTVFCKNFRIRWFDWYPDFEKSRALGKEPDNIIQLNARVG